jgi:Putative adhesin
VNKTFENIHDLNLNLRLPAGRMEVLARETTEVELRLEPENSAARELLESGGVTVELRQRGEGHELLVEVPGRRGGWLGRGPQFDLRIECPSGSRVSARSGSSDFESQGTLGSLEVKTASGDVDVDRVDGQVSIQSASGDVQIESALGPVDVNTASGDVDLGTVERTLKANLVSGDLSVREAGESVKANSVSGDQQVEAVSRGKIELHTVSGDIDVGVRRGTDVWLDVRSISGDMVSNLQPTDGPADGEGELVELHVKSVSGDVRIDHAPAAVG